ncbi:hypothetical protein OG921_02445 [Aldersonia sp. NBC_00410]|nr:hypothetical protein [Aldersonia sp. NBC_00410]MCX5042054.1 hypothetical protein [Aldersonia sp. NBC_00410]
MATFVPLAPLVAGTGVAGTADATSATTCALIGQNHAGSMQLSVTITHG